MPHWLDWLKSLTCETNKLESRPNHGIQTWIVTPLRASSGMPSAVAGAGVEGGGRVWAPAGRVEVAEGAGWQAASHIRSSRESPRRWIIDRRTLRRAPG